MSNREQQPQSPRGAVIGEGASHPDRRWADAVLDALDDAGLMLPRAQGDSVRRPHPGRLAALMATLADIAGRSRHDATEAAGAAPCRHCGYPVPADVDAPESYCSTWCWTEEGDDSWSAHIDDLIDRRRGK